jgi:hypothetical protein
MFTSSRRVAVALGVGALLTGGIARAQDQQTMPMLNPPPPDVATPAEIGPQRYQANTGLQVGVRTGYGGGSGIVYHGLSVMDATSGSIPIYIDLGVRVIPQFYAGLYGSWGAQFIKNNPVSCPGELDCKTNQYRFGVEFDFHPTPHNRLDGYIGLGGGYEILHTSINGTLDVPTPLGTLPAQASAGIIDRGWEFATLTGGFDYRINRGVGIGPVLSASLAEYGVHSGNQSASINGTQVSNTPVAPVTHGLHELYFAGIRGTFNP